jgi:hypothetical protein
VEHGEEHDRDRASEVDESSQVRIVQEFLRVAQVAGQAMLVRWSSSTALAWPRTTWSLSM